MCSCLSRRSRALFRIMTKCETYHVMCNFFLQRHNEFMTFNAIHHVHFCRQFLLKSSKISSKSLKFETFIIDYYFDVFTLIAIRSEMAHFLYSTFFRSRDRYSWKHLVRYLIIIWLSIAFGTRDSGLKYGYVHRGIFI